MSGSPKKRVSTRRSARGSSSLDADFKPNIAIHVIHTPVKKMMSENEAPPSPAYSTRSRLKIEEPVHMLTEKIDTIERVRRNSARRSTVGKEEDSNSEFGEDVSSQQSESSSQIPRKSLKKASFARGNIHKILEESSASDTSGEESPDSKMKLQVKDRSSASSNKGTEATSDSEADVKDSKDDKKLLEEPKVLLEKMTLMEGKLESSPVKRTRKSVFPDSLVDLTDNCQENGHSKLNVSQTEKVSPKKALAVSEEKEEEEKPRRSLRNASAPKKCGTEAIEVIEVAESSFEEAKLLVSPEKKIESPRKVSVAKETEVEQEVEEVDPLRPEASPTKEPVLYFTEDENESSSALFRDYSDLDECMERSVEQYYLSESVLSPRKAKKTPEATDFDVRQVLNWDTLGLEEESPKKLSPKKKIEESPKKKIVEVNLESSESEEEEHKPSPRKRSPEKKSPKKNVEGSPRKEKKVSATEAMEIEVEQQDEAPNSDDAEISQEQTPTKEKSSIESKDRLQSASKSPKTRPNVSPKSGKVSPKKTSPEKKADGRKEKKTSTTEAMEIEVEQQDEAPSSDDAEISQEQTPTKEKPSIESEDRLQSASKSLKTRPYVSPKSEKVSPKKTSPEKKADGSPIQELSITEDQDSDLIQDSVDLENIANEKQEEALYESPKKETPKKEQKKSTEAMEEQIQDSSKPAEEKVSPVNKVSSVKVSPVKKVSSVKVSPVKKVSSVKVSPVKKASPKKVSSPVKKSLAEHFFKIAEESKKEAQESEKMEVDDQDVPDREDSDEAPEEVSVKSSRQIVQEMIKDEIKAKEHIRQEKKEIQLKKQQRKLKQKAKKLLEKSKTVEEAEVTEVVAEPSQHILVDKDEVPATEGVDKKKKKKKKKKITPAGEEVQEEGKPSAAEENAKEASEVVVEVKKKTQKPAGEEVQEKRKPSAAEEYANEASEVNIEMKKKKKKRRKQKKKVVVQPVENEKTEEEKEEEDKKETEGANKVAKKKRKRIRRRDRSAMKLAREAAKQKEESKPVETKESSSPTKNADVQEAGNNVKKSKKRKRKSRKLTNKTDDENIKQEEAPAAIMENGHSAEAPKKKKGKITKAVEMIQEEEVDANEPPAKKMKKKSTKLEQDEAVDDEIAAPAEDVSRKETLKARKNKKLREKHKAAKKKGLEEKKSAKAQKQGENDDETGDFTETGIRMLPTSVLEKLENVPDAAEKKKKIRRGLKKRQLDDEAKPENRKKVKLTDDYIPLDVNGTTDFGLVPLEDTMKRGFVSAKEARKWLKTLSIGKINKVSVKKTKKIEVKLGSSGVAVPKGFKGDQQFS
ncbi:Hypothetical predicted protein [Cloeon dipterum]|uniref:Uncharacterized protein n=2 Tax=Cloeon dipterum TaxID=197152 RepID=A0A8S1DAG3_9INSE|nr:Hypothetical predicted protein [Cloeon dipterum]